MYYLLKTEPSKYSFADLQNEGITIWDGITNPAARKNLSEMPKGAMLVIYHAGAEKQAVGLATALSIAGADSREPRVEIKAGRALAKPITFAELKSNDIFRDSPLVRQGRLSVVSLTAAQYAFIAER
jgi:predicted RNA-binding protein with PUA-like domain